MRIQTLLHGIGEAAEAKIDQLRADTGGAVALADDIVRTIRRASLKHSVIFAVLGFTIRHILEYLR